MEKIMTSHELANALLNLEDKPVCIITHVDGQYVQTKYVTSQPWEDPFGEIRIQTNSVENLVGQ